MQNQVYSRYIYQMLMDHGRVAVPSIGTFVLQYSEASLDRIQSKLYPPSTRVYFTTEFDSKFRLSELLIESGLSDEYSHQIERLFAKDFNISKEKGQFFEWDGFGHFKNDLFEEKESGIFNKYIGLNEETAIPVAPVTIKIKHQEDYLYNLGKPLKSKESTFISDFIWPILLAIITVVLISIWFYSRSSNDADTAKTIKITTDTQYHQGINDVAPDDYQDSMNGEKFASEQIETDEVITQKEDKSTDIDLTETGALSSYNECVLIVGAFKNGANAKKMIKKIISRGYKPYDEVHNGLKRVGISYNCRSNDPETFKLKMRKVFGREAWNLHDTI